MAIPLLIFWSIGALTASRWICGRWANHLSLYTCVWTATIFAFSLNLIHYHHIVFEAWMYIFVAWVAIYAGTAIVEFSVPRAAPKPFPELNMKRLRNIIVLFSAAGLASSAVLAHNIVRALGTGNFLEAMTDYANQIYELRFNGDVSGLLYFDFLPYAGCVLAGIYTARRGRVTLAAILPLFAMIVSGIFSMQRAGMLFGIFLLVSSYWLTPKVSKLHVPKWQKVTLISGFLIAFIGVTVQRGGAPRIAGETETLAVAGDYVSVLPTLDFYASGPIACFSEYLKHPENDGKALWGRYMFASIYRFLAKFGQDTDVSYYQNFYYTPEPINVGTYLRELHRDFGGTALFIFPFFLGMSIAALDRCGRTTASIVLLSFLYLVVFFSFDINFVGGGGWYFPLPLALLALAAVKTRRTQYALPAMATVSNLNS